jgi:hypothetical protein
MFRKSAYDGAKRELRNNAGCRMGPRIFTARAELKSTWQNWEPEEVLGRLEKAAGIKGQQAQTLLPQMPCSIFPACPASRPSSG